MGRHASPRYYPSRGGYYAWINGTQTLLAKGPEDGEDGPTYQAALARFKTLTGSGPAPPTVDTIAEAFLARVARENAADTHVMRARGLQRFREAFGTRYPESVTVEEVEKWGRESAARRKWSGSALAITYDAIAACFNWARKNGLLARHGLKELQRPQRGKRALECVLEDADCDRAETACQYAQLRALLVVLRETGARPGELRKAEAKHYSVALNALVYEAADYSGRAAHKTGRTGQRRVILLSGRSLEIVRGLVQRHPTGPLFRTPHVRRTGPHAGQRWAWTTHGMGEAFGRLRRKLGLPGLVPYSFRHSFAMKWLRAGRPAVALAAVLGTSLDMIERHYGHLTEQHDYLRGLLKQQNDGGSE